MKKVITYILYALGIAAFGAYIRFCGVLLEQSSPERTCREIRVTVLDGGEKHYLTPVSVQELIRSTGAPLGKKLDEINVNALESALDGYGIIKKSEIALDRSGVMHVRITQRKPVLRLQGRNGSSYMDDTGYRFPISDLFTANVPVVTGKIPANDPQWDDGILGMGLYLDIHRFWNDQIEQIDVTDGGELRLYTRIGNQTVFFGRPDAIDYKFRKLYSYYRDIAPRYGWNCYESIDLKYSDQIVCKRKQK